VTGLPTGNVTFFFTDIEGSTRLWERYAQEMSKALARHDALVRDSIAAHGGFVFRTGGDAFCAAFQSATDALAAALDIQHLLTAEPWHKTGLPPGEVIRVRIAMHTCDIEPHNGDYGGPPLNRIARLLAVGHGGQTLLSSTTAAQLADQLPIHVALRDLGEHRLRDLVQPEHIFQVDIVGLATSFPPLRLERNQPTMPNVISVEEPVEVAEQGWHQLKMPGLPQIDYDAVLERDRQLLQRRSRKKRPDTEGFF
jgi:class 3 adenylate cyclase